MDAAVLGKARRWALDLDVNHREGFIDAMFKKALKEAKKIVT